MSDPLNCYSVNFVKSLIWWLWCTLVPCFTRMMLMYTGALFHSYDGDVHWCSVPLVWWWYTLVLCFTRMMVMYTGALFHSYDGDVHWCSVLGSSPLLHTGLRYLERRNIFHCWHFHLWSSSRTISSSALRSYLLFWVSLYRDAIMIGMPLYHYDRYAIMISMPLWSVCHYDFIMF